LKILKSIVINIKAVWNGFRNSNGLLWTTVLTYTTLFALVPLFAVALSLFKFFGGFVMIQGMLLPILSDFLDPSQKIQVVNHIQSFVENINISKLGTVGMIIFIFTSLPLFLEVDEAINTLWGKTDTRALWIKFTMFWSLTTLGPVALVIIFSAMSFLERFFPELSILLKSIKVLMTCLILLVLFLIYKLVPNTKVNNRPAFIGSFVSSVLWVVSYLFYQQYMKYTTYSFNIYGSLGAVPVFLLWIYINWLILLLGVQITRQAQYPSLTGNPHLIEPSNKFCAAVDIFKLLFSGMSRGIYYDEHKLISKLASIPPEVSSTAISTLISSGLLLSNGKLLLPAKGMHEIKVLDMLHLFMGNIENEIISRYSLDITKIKHYSLDDLK